MLSKGNAKNLAIGVYKVVYYNMKVIFAGKFIYFVIAALSIYAFLMGIYLMNPDTYLSDANMFWLLFIPGILIVFYPTAFGIQNDLDYRMLEIIFGIPNYRYKVPLVRLFIIMLITVVFLICVGEFTAAALTKIPVHTMVFQVIVPVLFFGCLNFALSTIIRDGNGTAVVVLILGILLWIGKEMFQSAPSLDVFLNPFKMPQNVSETAWRLTVGNNRLYLSAGSVVAILFGLLNLQKREKFLR